MNRKRRRIFVFLLSLLLLVTFNVQNAFAYVITATRPIVNTFDAQEMAENDLFIIKKVEHPFGENYTLPHITFDFAVEAGSYYAGYTFTTTAGSVTADENGTFVVSVAIGSKVGISGLEAGTTVKVTELQSQNDGFEPKDGKTAMELVIAETQTAVAEFVNVYTPTPVTGADIDITGKKELVGRDWQNDDKFSFVLWRQDGDFVSIGTAVAVNAAFDFGDIMAKENYSAAGTYTYRITETAGNKSGMHYDTQISTFTVTVSDKDMDGYLEIEEVSGSNASVSRTDGRYNVSVTFTNTYTPPATPSEPVPPSAPDTPEPDTPVNTPIPDTPEPPQPVPENGTSPDTSDDSYMYFWLMLCALSGILLLFAAGYEQYRKLHRYSGK